MKFRQKILLSFLVIFLIFTVFLYPVGVWLIEMIQKRDLHTRTIELVKDFKTAPNLQALIKSLEKRKELFFCISLINSSGEYLYDSYGNELVLKRVSLLEQNEVERAFKDKRGYAVHFSPTFGQKMAYSTICFIFQGKEYVLRTAFPYDRIASLTGDLALTFLLLGIAVLFLFGVLAWLIIHILTRPVQQIIETIKPYQLGDTNLIPEIKIKKSIYADDEFGNLAKTFNSLSKRIDHQISSLIHEKNEKSAILETLVEGVVAVNHNLTVIYMNRMAKIFLGIEDIDLVGQHFSVLNRLDCEELIQKAQEKGQPNVLIITPERKQKRYLDAVAVPRGKGGAILVLQDKTSLHKVLELGRDFIANASHELKTPITIIRGFAETLHDHPELTREIYKEITEKIVTNCQRMDTLVINLLTLAAVDEGLPRSRLLECDLYDLADQTKNTILSVHPDTTITIETRGEGPFLLMADSDLLFQAILNLLDNGVKYSLQPARIIIHIEKFSKEIQVHISDRGIGIPAEDLDRIFERFYAVDKSSSRSLGGSGLGLSIVERIIEKHQGKIEVESTPGEGTTFTLILPIQDY